MGKIAIEPKQIFNEYQKGNTYKNNIGDKGIYEQSKINERFYVGDQWYGANCGNYRPLVRRNVIKRIADYKMSTIAAPPIAVNYSADGVPDNKNLISEKKERFLAVKNGADFEKDIDNAEISVITNVLSNYFRTTAERVKFNKKKETALRNAYISGTGIAYTYWDDQIKTGLYADDNKTTAINGDINFEILDIENVNFGDPNSDDVQSQPFIIISQRKNVWEVLREAKRNGINKTEIKNIRPDNADGFNINAGVRGEDEPSDSQRVTVLTKFYKEWDEVGEKYRVMCVRVCEKAYIRKPWDTGLTLYPIAKMCWSPLKSCAYGDSEITYQIPNQIAINKATSAEIWAIMTAGMPKTVINGDTITAPLTNNPGEVIKVYGTNEDVAGAIRHISPPEFSNQLIEALNDLAKNTLSDNGANEVALGNLRPDNAAAIIQMREAALQPLQIYQNAFYDFIEDIARIWADFWINLYGDRKLRIKDKDGVFYIPFHPNRYKNLLFTAHIDVGSSPMWNVTTTISMLDSLYEAKIIDKVQYLERMPDGVIPDKKSLLMEVREQMEIQNKEINKEK